MYVLHCTCTIKLLVCGFENLAEKIITRFKNCMRVCIRVHVNVCVCAN